MCSIKVQQSLLQELRETNVINKPITVTLTRVTRD